MMVNSKTTRLFLFLLQAIEGNTPLCPIINGFEKDHRVSPSIIYKRGGQGVSLPLLFENIKTIANGKKEKEKGKAALRYLKNSIFFP